VLQWNAERRRGRLAIIALLHARVGTRFAAGTELLDY
jgi:hypothetical protein